MKIKIHKKELVRAFGIAASATMPKSSLPILANVRIDVDAHIRFSGTDLTLSAVVDAMGEVHARGSMLVPAAQFLAAARAMPEGEVTVQTANERIELSSGKSKQRVGFASVDEYPMILSADETDLEETSAKAIATAIGAVAHCASTDEARANLAGVRLSCDDGRCRAEATDGHRYARRFVECQPFKFAALLPAQSLREVRRVLDSVDGPVHIGERSGYAFFVADGVTMVAKLTGETFPNADRLIPAKPTHRVIVHRETLLDAFKRVMTASDDAARPVEMVIGDGSIQLRIDASRGDASASDEVSCDYAGKGITIGIRGAYAIAALSALESADVTVKLNRDLDPVQFVPVDGDDHLQLVMPSKI